MTRALKIAGIFTLACLATGIAAFVAPVAYALSLRGK